MPPHRADPEAAGVSARSWLFVPGDSEKKQARAIGSGADALILDLEDSVAEANLPQARTLVAALLRSATRGRTEFWVRVNALTSPHCLADLVAVVPAAPSGVMLPKSESAADVATLHHYVTALEAAAGLPDGGIRIAAIATETPASLFTLGGYTGAPRLSALTWGAEDLAASLGAASNRAADGSYDLPYQLARTLCLAGAVAAGVDPIDTVFTNFRDSAGLDAEARAARRAGFTGKMAIHPDQVPIINAAFTPDAAEVAHARSIVDAFAANPGLGTVGIGGKMIDRPHLKQAQRILDLAARVSALSA